MKNVICAIMLMLFCTTCVAGDAQSLLDEVIAKTVKDGRVDYNAIARDHLPSLDAALDQMANTDPQKLEKMDQLAFYINLYNASMIKAVIDRGGEKFKPSDDNFKVFKDPLVRLLGKPVSLDTIEHDIIRKQFKDARIHAALVCAAVSCPPLIKKAYRGQTLDKQLDDNVNKWLADTTRNVIDDQNKVLKLSSIFKWFAEDFGGEANLSKWVSDKVGRDVSGYRVVFMDYDWTLNASARP